MKPTNISNAIIVVVGSTRSNQSFEALQRTEASQIVVGLDGAGDVRVVTDDLLPALLPLFLCRSLFFVCRRSGLLLGFALVD